jgi:hypothetical protein
MGHYPIAFEAASADQIAEDDRAIAGAYRKSTAPGGLGKPCAQAYLSPKTFASAVLADRWQTQRGERCAGM